MIKEVFYLDNSIMNYDWGIKNKLSELLGNKDYSNLPEAELWIGTHTKAPSKIFNNKRFKTLKEAIEKNIYEILGNKVADKFNELPFLLKLLTVGKPLSIQAHPNKKLAEEGFEKENKRGIYYFSSKRNYRDSNHKPEMLYALTPFYLMHGFRSKAEIINNLKKIQDPILNEIIIKYKDKRSSNFIKEIFYRIISLENNIKNKIIKSVISASKKHKGELIFDWIIRLYDMYSYDLGVIAPLYLNIYELKPGEACFISSQTLHSYLEGIGIELMANSDNVIRGGLTNKYVDIKELLKIIIFKESKIQKLKPTTKIKNEVIYKSLSEEFQLSYIELNDEFYIGQKNRNVEIFFCLDGGGYIKINKSKKYEFTKGDSFCVPSSIKEYEISGKGIIYKATSPI